MAPLDRIDALESLLARQPGLELAILFGSMASGRQRPDSDLDLAVQAARPLTVEHKLALVGQLALASGRAVDLVDLRTVGEPLLGQILSRGRRLLGSDEAHAALLRRHLLDAADFLPYAQRMVTERRQAWIVK